MLGALLAALFGPKKRGRLKGWGDQSIIKSCVEYQRRYNEALNTSIEVTERMPQWAAIRFHPDAFTLVWPRLERRVRVVDPDGTHRTVVINEGL